MENTTINFNDVTSQMKKEDNYIGTLSTYLCLGDLLLIGLVVCSLWLSFQVLTQTLAGYNILLLGVSIIIAVGLILQVAFVIRKQLHHFFFQRYFCVQSDYFDGCKLDTLKVKDSLVFFNPKLVRAGETFKLTTEYAKDSGEILYILRVDGRCHLRKEDREFIITKEVYDKLSLAKFFRKDLAMHLASFTNQKSTGIVLTEKDFIIREYL